MSDLFTHAVKSITWAETSTGNPVVRILCECGYPVGVGVLAWPGQSDEDARTEALTNAVNEYALHCEDALAERLKRRRDRMLAIIRDLADPDPCDHFDHHGHCQTHGWLEDGECAHARAHRLLAAESPDIFKEQT